MVFHLGWPLPARVAAFFASLGWYKPWYKPQYKKILTPKSMNFANLLKVVKFDHFSLLYNPAPKLYILSPII